MYHTNTMSATDVRSDNISKKIYQNKHGCMDLKSFIYLMHTGEIDTYMRKFSTLKDPCPPYELIDDSIRCFFCVDCQRQCISRVKEYKNYYKVGRTKIDKTELGE